jgi:hypothetical protein
MRPDWRAGVDMALGPVVSVFGEARSHHAYLDVINGRAFTEPSECPPRSRTR